MNLENIFRQLEQHGLKGSKCEFFHRQVQYLSYIVRDRGVQTDP